MKLRQLQSNNKAKIFFSVLVFVHIAIMFVLRWVPEIYFTGNISLILGQANIILPMCLYAIVSGGEAFGHVRTEKLSLANMGIILLLTLTATPIMTFFNLMSQMFAENEIGSVLMDTIRNPFPVSIILVGIIPALFEEIAFRGIIFHGLRRKSVISGIIFTGLAFGAFHMNVNQFFYAFVMGMIMSLVVEVTDSIYASILMHGIVNINNTTILYLSKGLQNMTQELQKQSGQAIQQTEQVTLQSLSMEQKMVYLVIFGIMAAGASVGLFFLIRWLAKRCGTWERITSMVHRTNKKESLQQKESKVQNILCNTLFVLGFLGCISVIYLNMIN